VLTFTSGALKPADGWYAACRPTELSEDDERGKDYGSNIENHEKRLKLARILVTHLQPDSSIIIMKQINFLEGRVGRFEYGFRLLLTLSPLSFLGYLPSPPQAWYHVLLMGVLLAACTALAALLSVRRLHDLHLSGWHALALLVPIVNLPAYLLLLVLPGIPTGVPEYVSLRSHNMR